MRSGVTELSGEFPQSGVFREASGGELRPATGFDESAAVEGRIYEFNRIGGPRVFGEEDSVLCFLQFSIGFEKFIAAAGDPRECGLFEQPGELPECVPIFRLVSSRIEELWEGFSGAIFAESEQSRDPRDLGRTLECCRQALFPFAELLGVVQQQQAASEFGVEGQPQEIGGLIQGFAAEFCGAGGGTGLFGNAGCCEQQQRIVRVGSGGLVQQSLILECSGGAGEDNQEFGGVPELDEAEDQWSGFSTPPGEREESCETGKNGWIVGGYFKSSSPRDFGAGEQCQTPLEDVGRFKGCFEAAWSVCRDG